MKRILIVNYGMGNLKSVANALFRLGYAATISGRREDLASADAYILPGVGAFGQAMKNLQALELVAPLREEVLGRSKPLLGICLGMQLLAEDSEELGLHAGLGWIPGHVKRLEARDGLRLPHVGWNEVEALRPEPLFRNASPRAAYYFDHTYQLACDDGIVTARVVYGRPLAAAIRRDNIFATQFHPEKSQVAGLRLLRGFLDHVERNAA